MWGEKWGLCLLHSKVIIIKQINPSSIQYDRKRSKSKVIKVQKFVNYHSVTGKRRAGVYVNDIGVSYSSLASPPTVCMRETEGWVGNPDSFGDNADYKI